MKQLDEDMYSVTDDDFWGYNDDVEDLEEFDSYAIVFAICSSRVTMILCAFISFLLTLLVNLWIG